ncbi:hypothetical protein Q5O24_00980 [Eubacteriaceae bacterium ES3]|nr:hypothetical protein Q5O24_00980 [Eubacteriaceae bacterium ES3]
MKKLTKREKMLLYILSCFLIATAGIYLLLIPAYNRYSTIRDQYMEAESTQMSMEAAIGSIPDLETAIDSNRATILTLQAPYSEPLTNEALDQLITNLCMNYSLSPQVLSITANGEQTIPVFVSTEPESESSEDSSIFNDSETEDVTEEDIQTEVENNTRAETTTDTTASGVTGLVGVVEMELTGTQNNFYRLLDAVSSRSDIVVSEFEITPSGDLGSSVDSGTTTTNISYSNWSQSLDGGAVSIKARFNVYMVERTDL